MKLSSARRKHRFELDRHRRNVLEAEELQGEPFDRHLEPRFWKVGLEDYSAAGTV